MWETNRQTSHKISIDERHSMIVDEVNQRSSLQVSDICERFRVSEVTARTDLDKLEQAGKLRRTHGGAVSITRTITVSYPDQRMNLNVEAKRAIAKIAATLVSDGDSILVDTGTTTFEFVRCLFDKRSLTIVTSDLSIATFADSSLPHAEVLMLGGALRKNHRYLTGPITNDNLAHIHVDKAFIACDSFSQDCGFTTEFTGNAEIKRRMLLQSRKHFMLIDATKVSAPSFIDFAGIQDFTAIISDYDPQGAIGKSIEDAQASTQLLVASDQSIACNTEHGDKNYSAKINTGFIGRQTSEHI